MISDLKTLVVSLKTNSIIFGALGNRIYIGQPQKIPDEVFITLNVITQIQNIDVNNRTRIEFRIIGNIGANIETLDNIEIEITKHIKANILNLGFFKYEIGIYYNGYDELKKPLIVRDFIFYKTT